MHRPGGAGRAPCCAGLAIAFSVAGSLAVVSSQGSSRRRSALARAGHHARIVPAGDEIAAVATLPIGTLRLSPDCIVGLNRLGPAAHWRTPCDSPAAR